MFGKFLSVTSVLALAGVAFAQQPIITTNYTCDPAPMVHGDTVYLYTTHDEDNAEGFVMYDWLLHTSTDMVNWTSHGAVASLNDIKWSTKTNGAWAEQVVFRNGKWYMYVPIHGNGISVLVADSPYGPFKEPLNKALVWQRQHWNDIDPTVWVDDDGQAYMYWGNPDLYMIKLNEDMISTSGNIVTYPKIKDYQEGPWFYKHGSHYYMAFASTCCAEGIGYAMSDSPTGPWTYKGDIMPHSSRSNGNHPGIIDYKGKSYVFGHHYQLWHQKSDKMGLKFQHKERRSVGVAEMKYNADGTIQKIDWWPDNGVAQLEDFNPYKRVEAETMSWGEEVRVRKSGAAGNTVLTNLTEGKYTKISGVEFGDAGAESFSASVLSVKRASSVTVRLDKVDGPVVAKAEFSKDGLVTVPAEGAVGKHDVFFVFAGDFEADYWEFEDSKTAVPQGPFCEAMLKDPEAKCELPVIGAKVEGLGNFIEFENYDVGGAGKAYYDMDSKNQGGEYREDRVDIVKNGDGYAIGYTQKGEWLEYTVNVEAGGTLPYELSYATGMEKAGIQLFMDGEAITDELELKGTGDFDEYTTFKGKTTKELTKGEHVLKVQITTDYVNLDWIAFGASDKSAEEIRNGSSETPEDTIPAFVMSTPAIDARISDEYKVFDLMGHQLGKVRLEGVTTSADIKIGLRNAGYRNGAYVIRNSAGRAFRIDACK
ncbi:carbohydrate binding protein with CBM6 domain [Fibrobacter sp. UWR4]|nr:MULTISPECIES: family 43 glycosylhydrolase [unclassified Fibrobacter]PWJ67112.1 carbohydrate binding protein with CBM6 domain [Fibrobacter sp. UWR4]PZW70679.1 carbohydrate binding protein with CBM6 domain [Fibrobacter sp. UWR1]